MIDEHRSGFCVLNVFSQVLDFLQPFRLSRVFPVYISVKITIFLLITSF